MSIGAVGSAGISADYNAYLNAWHGYDFADPAARFREVPVVWKGPWPDEIAPHLDPEEHQLNDGVAKLLARQEEFYGLSEGIAARGKEWIAYEDRGLSAAAARSSAPALPGDGLSTPLSADPNAVRRISSPAQMPPRADDVHRVVEARQAVGESVKAVDHRKVDAAITRDQIHRTNQAAVTPSFKSSGTKTAGDAERQAAAKSGGIDTGVVVNTAVAAFGNVIPAVIQGPLGAMGLSAVSSVTQVAGTVASAGVLGATGVMTGMEPDAPQQTNADGEPVTVRRGVGRNAQRNRVRV